MKIGFFSSSDFTLPILEDIISKQGLTVKQVFFEQLEMLKNQISYWPENHLLNKFLVLDWEKLLDSLCFHNPELNSGIELNLVVSQPDRKNRKKILTNPISSFARSRSLNLWTPESVNKQIDQLYRISSGIDLGIVASFGQIFKPAFLNYPKFGLINWHPSLLPKYRGATPMQSSLLNGDKITGLSWITMEEGMDSGPILLQISQNLEITLDFYTLSKLMGILGSHTWALAIVSQVSGFFKELQNPESATFCGLVSKADGLIDPRKLTAEEIYNHYRAFQYFPKTFFEDEYFEGQVKLLQIRSFFQDISFDNQEKIFENQFWIQQKNQERKIQTYLKAKNQTYLQVLKIGLENGKTIDFSGYIF